MTDATIFEQDGKMYFAASHSMPARDLAKAIAKEIRALPTVPRAKMRIVTAEEVRAAEWAAPSKD